MKDTILTILVIGGIFIGLPLLIVCAKDRGGVMGLIVNRVIGGIGLVIGLSIIGWVVYNILNPTAEFKASVFMSSQLNTVTAVCLMIPRLAVPLIMIGLGWRWLTGKRDEPEEESENKELKSDALGRAP